MYPHRIHLHGPWQRGGEAGKLVLPPGQLARFEATEALTLRRPFRWPTPLMPFERLWLVASCSRPVQIMLNERPLGEHDDPWAAFEADITALVQPVNQLTLTLHAMGPSVLGPVYLEVRRDVHLTGLVGEVIWEAERPRLRLTGRLHGELTRPVSLVVRLDEREVLYTNLPPGPSVDVVTSPLEVRRWQAGQVNVSHQIDCQLLDPACVLSQHSFATGFRTVQRLARGEYLVNGLPVRVEPMRWEEPLDESAALAEADRQGRLLVLAPPRNSTGSSWQYLWHHPSVLAVEDARAH
jgi:hypothetical protein